MKKLRGIFLLGFILLTGCATTTQQCDPSARKNTAVTLSCIFSGHYKSRQISLEAALEEEKSITESLTQINALLDDERSGVSRSLATTKAQYSKLNKTLQKLIAQISANSQGNAAIQQKIDELNDKLAMVNESDGSLEKKLALKSLSTEVENLKQELGYN